MRCPRDGTTLELSMYKKVEIDFCSYCNGAWLDSKELAQITKKNQDILKPDASEEGMPTKLKCPRCQGQLILTHYSEKKEVEIDRCKECGGIWLDTDELKDVLKIAFAS